MKYLLLLLSITVIMGCNQPEQGSNQQEQGSNQQEQDSNHNNHVNFPFENGVSMEETSIDPMGNIFSYPEGEAGITGQTAQWEKGFESGGIIILTLELYVIRGELTVKFDENTALSDLDGKSP